MSLTIKEKGAAIQCPMATARWATFSSVFAYLCGSRSMHARYVRRPLMGQVAHATLHDEGKAFLVLQHANVLQRIAADQQQIGEITFPHRAKLVAALHDLAAGSGCRLQRQAVKGCAGAAGQD
jgi:hypothetical protein